VTIVAALIVTAQVPVPEHPPPDQPMKVAPVPATAVRVTTVPGLKEALQVVPQSMPDGEEVTVPVPVPVVMTARGYEDGSVPP
jgi:hypothetical protein